MTECQGTWGSERELGETGITVIKCSGCDEVWSIYRGRRVGVFHGNPTDEEIIRDYLERR